MKYLLIAGAGAAGSLSRYLLAGLVQSLAGSGFAWGTLAVNVTGCFGAGLLFALGERYGVLSDAARSALLIGFFGAFTTFSTLALETWLLLREGAWWLAAGGFLAHNALGIGAVVLAAGIVKLIL